MNKNSFQKLFLFFLILVIPFFILKEYKHIKSKKQIKCTSKHLQIPHSKAVADKSFVIIIPAYNNLEFYEKNLKSISDQSYKNYRVIYIDQGSTDGSLQKVKSYLSEKKLDNRFKLIELDQKDNPFISYYKAVHACQDQEIVVHLDGNDWLAHEKVLSILNQVYASDDVWLTYGQYLEYPSYKKGIGKNLTNRALTKSKLLKSPWIISHLKTYYAGLFKRIKIEECSKDNDFPKMDEVTPFILPMIKRARKHIRFIPEVLYVHNGKLKGKEKRNLKLGYFSDQFPKSLKSDKKELSHLEQNVSQADIVIFSNSELIKLSLCLESIYCHVKGVNRIIIVHESRESLFLEKLKKRYASCIFINALDFAHMDYKSFLLQNVIGNYADCPWVLLTTDNIVTKGDIELSECIHSLNLHHAYGFYFHLGKKMRENTPMAISFPPHCRLVGGGIYAWKIEEGPGEWKYPDCIQMGLYEKKTLESTFNAIEFNNLDSLVENWKKYTDMSQRVGLFYEKIKLFTLNEE